MRRLLSPATLILATACSGPPAEDRSGDVTAAPAAASPGLAPESAAAPVPAPAGEHPADQPAGADTLWTVRRVDHHPPASGVATLLALRSAAHPGYDRVVLEFGPGGLPGYRAEYVDRPQHACGSGEEVRLEGDAWIQLDLEPARAHDDEGGATLAQRSLRPALANVLELRLICDFEAHVSWVVAVRRPTAFRMLRLGQPDRLVLDVRR